MTSPEFESQEIRQAFAEYDRETTVSNFKVACVIGMVLMPVGYVLDKYMYPHRVMGQFLELRFVCSILNRDLSGGFVDASSGGNTTVRSASFCSCCPHRLSHG